MAEGWRNENRNRAYPFIRETVHRVVSGPVTLRNLPNELIVDAGFVPGAHSQFDPAQHSVWLNRLWRSGLTVYFEFASDAPGLFEVPLTFSRSLATDEDGHVEFLDSGEEGLSASSVSAFSDSVVGGRQEPRWSGFLVTGRMSDIAAFIASGEILRGTGGAVIEPATIQSLATAYVTSFGIANQDRTRSQTADGSDCPATAYPFEIDRLRIYDACLQGAVVFQPGYNSTIRQNPSENSLTFGAVVGAGAGQPCAELPLFTDETPPAGSSLLSGGPQCREVLRSINGISGPRHTIDGGTGVTVTALPDAHTVAMDVDMSGLAVCFESVSILGDD